MGVSFGAGTTDGPGASIWFQGMNMTYINENLDGDDYIWFQIRDQLGNVY